MYSILAYYRFCALADPQAEIAAHLAFFRERAVTARIYISEQGINGQLCANPEDAKAYCDWINQHPLFKGMHFKMHTWHEPVFPRLTVKYRKNLVGMDGEINLNQTGIALSPAQWKEKIEENKHLLLDVRNEYEWKVGHFEGAELPACETFREFETYAEQLKEKHDPKTTPIMMYCTGGIRCELYSSLLMDKGFEQVYQLEGGIINYGLQEGSHRWLGKLFVFDDRLAVPISDEAAPVIGQCHHCQTSSENYYNCANCDCNELFLCCQTCLENFKGCCQSSCAESSRLRPFYQLNPHKPFRRLHHYLKNKGEENKD